MEVHNLKNKLLTIKAIIILNKILKILMREDFKGQMKLKGITYNFFKLFLFIMIVKELRLQYNAVTIQRAVRKYSNHKNIKLKNKAQSLKTLKYRKWKKSQIFLTNIKPQTKTFQMNNMQENFYKNYIETKFNSQFFLSTPINPNKLQKQKAQKQQFCKRISSESYKKYKKLKNKINQQTEQKSRLIKNNKQIKKSIDMWIDQQKENLEIQKKRDTFEYLKYLLQSNNKSMNAISSKQKQTIIEILEQLHAQKIMQLQLFITKLSAIQRKLIYKDSLNILNEKAWTLQFQGQNKIARYHGIHEFVKYDDWPNLTKLSLSDNDIGDQGLIQLSKAKMPNLVFLNLQMNNLKTLNNIQKFNQVQELRLNYKLTQNQNEFSKKAAQNLTSTIWKNLKTLSIQFKNQLSYSQTKQDTLQQKSTIIKEGTCRINLQNINWESQTVQITCCQQKNSFEIQWKIINDQSQTSQYKCQNEGWQIFLDQVDRAFPVLEHLQINNTSLISERTLKLIKQKTQSKIPRMCLHIQNVNRTN